MPSGHVSAAFFVGKAFAGSLLQVSSIGSPSKSRQEKTAGGSMPTRIGYHYSDKLWKVGDVIPGYDNLAGLHPSLHTAEQVVRSARTNGTAIRSSAVYVWDSEDRARQQWAAAGRVGKAKKYLYRVEYADANLLHKGDLNHYTAALDAKANLEKAREAADLYWSGQPHAKEAPRIEVLVRKAVVIDREDYRPKPPEPIDDSVYSFLSEPQDGGPESSGKD